MEEFLEHFFMNLINIIFLVFVIVAISFVIFIFILDYRVKYMVKRKGGRISVDQLITKLKNIPYSIISIYNPANKPEILVFPKDVGDHWMENVQFDNFESWMTNEWESNVKLFQKTLQKEFAWILEFDDEILDSLSTCAGTLDVVENKIGYDAAQKIDFAMINVNWDEIDCEKRKRLF